MMKVTVVESTIVRPAQDMPNQHLWLSNLDLVHPRYYLPTVYLYKPSSDHSSNFFEAKLLKEALSKVLVPFYPVAGRLARDENGRIEINCNGEGVLFVEAETDSTTSELGDFMPSLELGQLIPTINDRNKSGDHNIYHNSADIDRNNSGDISSHPLLLLQVTKFKCGGVCLGVGFLHTVADGAGALHFINSWSSIARGALSISDIPTFLDRTVLRGRQVPPKSRFHHVEYEPAPTMKTPTKNPKSQSFANFKITLDQLKALKAKVNNHQTKTTKYTTYEILTAHIWRCTCKARDLFRDEEQATKLRIAVDGRSRLNPPLPPCYFGNVIFIAAIIAMSSDLLSESLADTVERIHKAINQMDDEYLRSALDYLEEIGDVSTEIVRGPQTCSCPNLSVASWMRLPFDKADFGWGPPLLMRPAKMFEGKGYLYPSPSDDGNFSLAICLETDHMQSFANLFYNF